MTSKTLFEPYQLGSLTLSNRIVMAPLTRNRAGPGYTDYPAFAAAPVH
jgi:N-ethylmaleimide reductase